MPLTVHGKTQGRVSDSYICQHNLRVRKNQPDFFSILKYGSIPSLYQCIASFPRHLTRSNIVRQNLYTHFTEEKSTQNGDHEGSDTISNLVDAFSNPFKSQNQSTANPKSTLK